MRKISLDGAETGMILAKPIVGCQGQMLLQEGVELRPQYIVYLKRLGIDSIYIKDSRLADIELNDIIAEETRGEARALVKEIMQDFRSPSYANKGLVVKDEKIKAVVGKILDELLENKDMVIHLQDIRAQGDYVFAHSVQCGIMATLTATKMGYKYDTLRSLAVGAILHDIGLLYVPEQLLQKPGPLTIDEYETIKQHPLYGYEIYKRSPLYSSVAGVVIVQHHERYNGSGYPKGLEGNAIHPLAQIVALSDIYDALTSHRPYRPAYSPHKAVEMLLGFGDMFQMDLLQAFLNSIAAYPIGTHVVLNNGESGLVIDCKPGLPLRPVVRVLYTGEDLAPHPRPYDIDLGLVLDLNITGVKD